MPAISFTVFSMALPLLLLLSLAPATHAAPSLYANVFDIRDYGAIGDGKTMNTLPFAKVKLFATLSSLSRHACNCLSQAVAAAASNYAQRGDGAPAVVSVAAGTYLTGQVALQVRVFPAQKLLAARAHHA
jgi:polygalacturonase